MSKSIRLYLLFFLALLSLSQAANLIRWAQAPALMIGFWRILGASLLMLGLRYLKTKDQTPRFHPFRSPFLEPMSPTTLLWIFLSGSFFFFHLWTFFLAAQQTTIANCMVLFATNPIFTAVGAWFFLKEHLEKRHIGAFLLAFWGLWLMMKDSTQWNSQSQGDLFAIISAIFFSGYLIASKKVRLQLNTEQLTGLMYLWTATLFLIFALIQQTPLTGYPATTWIAIAGNILIPTLLGHVLFTALLKHFNINWMSCGKLIEPAFSAIVAYLAFGESLQQNTWISFLFFAAAIFLLLGPQLFKKSNT